MKSSCQLSAISYQPESPRQSSPAVAGVAASPRPSSPPHPAPRAPRPARRAFSLVELMIAIMILGLGMVMAATVFPVSLDMTRGTVQLNISETAADAAVATLALRVPRYKDLDRNPLLPDYDAAGFPVNAKQKVPLADVTRTQDNFIIDDTEQLLINSPPLPLTWLEFAPPLTSLFTEASFWDSQYSPVGAVLSTFVVRAQNLRPLSVPPYHETVTEQPPSYPVAGVPLDFDGNPAARISIADRVYPPVDLQFDFSTTPPTFLLPQTLAQIAQRRYSWTAIHFRDVSDENEKMFFARIVILYRGTNNARYAKQDFTTLPAYEPQPDPNNLADTDTLLPQAWLVMLNSVSATGVVQCTPHVANLLPAGSYFILARGTQPGAYTKVLQNNWDRQFTTTIVPTLQIKPGDFPAGVDVPVWVFPPAIRSAAPNNRHFGNVHLESTSPVVDVVPKKLVAG